MKPKATSPPFCKPRNRKGHSVLALKVTPITKYFAVQAKAKVEIELKKEMSEILADDLIRRPLKTTLNTPTKKPLQVHKPKRLASTCRTVNTDDLFCRSPIKQSRTSCGHSLQQSSPRKEEKAGSLDENSPVNLSPSAVTMPTDESTTHYKQEPSDAPPAASYLRTDSIVISDSPPQPDPVCMVDLTVDLLSSKKVCPMAIDLTESPALSAPVEGASTRSGIPTEKGEIALQSLFREGGTVDAEMNTSETGLLVAATASTVVELHPLPSPTKEPLPANTAERVVSELVPCSDSAVSTTMAALSLQTPTKPQQGFVKAPNAPCPRNQPTEAMTTVPSCLSVSPSVIPPSSQVPSASTKAELELMLWQRGVPYTLQPGESQSKVLLFTKTQNCIAENLAEGCLRVSSRKLCALVAYLRHSTSALIMPRSSNLRSLWDMVMDTHTVSNHVSWESLMELIGFLRTLLSVHPPGQHPIVDQQYASFVASLGPGGPFSAWEDLHNLLRGPQYCTHLFAYIVDLLLSDYWASLASIDGGQRRPLFVGLFWEQLDNAHITTPLRKFIHLTLSMVTDLNRNSEVEVSKLESCMALLFLAATRCRDLETELTIACRGLQPEQQSLFLSYIQPTPLRAAIIRSYFPTEQRVSLSTQTDGVLTPHVTRCLPPPSSTNMTSSPLQATDVSAVLPTVHGSDTDSTKVLNICALKSVPPQMTTAPVVAGPPSPSSDVTHSTTQLKTSTSHQAVVKSKPKSALLNAITAPAVRNVSHLPATKERKYTCTSKVPYKPVIAMNKSTQLRYQLAGKIAPCHTTTRYFTGNAKGTGCEKCSGGTCVHCRPKRSRAWV